MVLLSSQVSSEPRSKSDVEHSESRRQADSRREMCVWGNRALAPSKVSGVDCLSPERDLHIKQSKAAMENLFK